MGAWRRAVISPWPLRCSESSWRLCDVGESFAVLPPGTLVAGDALAGLGRMSLAVSSLLFQTTLILVLPVSI